MPWVKHSDTSALHPLIMGIRGRIRGYDDRSTNELYGWLARVSSTSAQGMTDYWFDVSTAEAMSPRRWEVLVRQARDAGLITQITGRGDGRRFRLVEDAELFHIRYREDVEWDRQRDRDRKNPELTNPVLLRDGDVCRYDGVVVNWNDRKGARGGTFDHRDPGQAATVETYVVSCRGCNSKRKASPDADLELPLRPAPAGPHFSPQSKTKERLEAFYAPESLETARYRLFSDPAARSARPSDPAASARPGDPAAGCARPETPSSTSSAPRPRGPDPGSIPDIEGGSRVGSGPGLGLDGSGTGTGAASPRRGSRGSRGSRGRR